MDIIKKIKNSPEQKKLIVPILITSLAVFCFWVFILVPRTLKQINSKSEENTLSRAGEKLRSITSIFKNEKEKQSTGLSEEPSIEELREKVFGDSIKR